MGLFKQIRRAMEGDQIKVTNDSGQEVVLSSHDTIAARMIADRHGMSDAQAARHCLHVQELVKGLTPEQRARRGNECALRTLESTARTEADRQNVAEFRRKDPKLSPEEARELHLSED